MSELLHPRTCELIPPTDSRLNRPSEAIAPENITSDFVQATIDRMYEMAAGKGHTAHDTRQMVGLAAIQLGIGLRVIAIDMTADGSNKEQTLEAIVNPEIAAHSNDTLRGREGCWSCGDICGVVDRFSEVTVTGLDRTGEPVERKLSGFIARIAQHEVDHLNGIRFPDRIPIDEPRLLHVVEPSEFERYRQEWANWQIICPRERWDEMKSGNTSVDI